MLGRALSTNEFCIGKSQQNMENRAECKVVINHNEPYGVVYPEVPDDGIKFKERSVSISSTPPPLIVPEGDGPYGHIDEFEGSLQFYKKLSSCLSNILRTNNPKMIANLIDNSGKVIIGARELVELIAEITGTNVNTVSIIYKTEEAGCLAKVNPIKNIKNIKIANVDFHYGFNKEYNLLNDEFSISLSKVYILD